MLSRLARTLLVALALAPSACGSVANKPQDGGRDGSPRADAEAGSPGTGGAGSPGTGGAGSPGTGGAGGATGGAGGAAGNSDAGTGDSGSDAGPGPVIRFSGRIEGVGPMASTSATVKLANAGLTFPRTRICNATTSICVSGGLTP